MATSITPILNVRDIQKSVKLYKALGFKVKDTWKHKGVTSYVDLDIGGASFGLASIPSSSDPDFVKWVSTPLGAGVLINVYTKGVDKIHAAAKKGGAIIEEPPSETAWGRMFTLNDFDGYTITFVQTKPAAVKKPAKKSARKGAKKGAKR